MASQKEQKEKSMLLALVLFVGAAGLVFAYLGSDDPKTRDIPRAIKSERFEKSVNRHLMLTNERMELERQRMAVENARLLNEISASAPQKPFSNNSRLDLSTETHAQEVANEMGRGERVEKIVSPHDMIQKELFNEQQAREYSRAYKEEYARQFVENARKGGYQIKLSEDLSRVISVQPIKPRTGMELFGDSTNGRQ